MQTVTFVGNLTRDPEIRFGASGKARANFGIAVNEKRGEEEVAHFFNCTAFGTLAENIGESLRKGNRVIVTGRLNTWKQELTLEDGTEKTITNVGITANSVGPDLLWARATVKKVDTRVSSDDGPPDDEAPAPKPKATKPKEKVLASVGAGEEDPF